MPIPYTVYIVFLKVPGMWLGPNRHWVEAPNEAHHFKSFKEAAEASEGYDVLIRTLELRALSAAEARESLALAPLEGE